MRAEDAFDEVVARAFTLDLREGESFEDATRRAASRLAQRLPVSAEHLAEGFLHGTQTGATPVSHGTALPHLRVPEADAPEMVLANTYHLLLRPGVDRLVQSAIIDIDRSGKTVMVATNDLV